MVKDSSEVPELGRGRAGMGAQAGVWPRLSTIVPRAQGFLDPLQSSQILESHLPCNVITAVSQTGKLRLSQDPTALLGWTHHRPLRGGAVARSLCPQDTLQKLCNYPLSTGEEWGQAQGAGSQL